MKGNFRVFSLSSTHLWRRGRGEEVFNPLIQPFTSQPWRNSFTDANPPITTLLIINHL